MKEEMYSGVWRLPFEQGGRAAGLSEERGWRKRLLGAAAVLGIWTLVGFFFASQIYFYFAGTPRAVPFLTALVWQMAAVYLSAVFTFLILWLARLFRFDRRKWPRSLLFHLPASFIIASIMTAGHLTIDAYFDSNFARVVFTNFPARVFVNIDKNFIVYWLIIWASHALNYYKRYRESELEASQLAAQLAEAQLQALKMQLHPHFLFNTLHSISSLLSRDTEAARRMIARLGDFLRLTLENSGAQEVSLRDELDFLRCYLDIEAIRFYDRLTVRMEIEPQTLSSRVPNLILQPIVENAIRHGIAPRSKPGLIEIRSARRGERLRLEVRDDGPGLPLELGSNRTGRRGIGLSNTQNRLRQLYGSEASFELMNDVRGGLLVILELPFHSEGKAQSNAA
ncbi:MAG TPA: histidine kinase [Pyrinomonadaceae bacterium]|nr:histidine kinase [Pyrinomonadaceae bacterium]